MVRKWTTILVVTMAAAASSCATVNPQANLPSPDDGGDGGNVLVRLSYTRPAQYGSTGRPGGFEVIANYRASDATSEDQGNWNDEAQTLTASFQLPMNSENLVYVVDEAVPPFIPTPIQAAANGRLRQIACPAAVTAVQVCYELTVVR